MSDIDTLRRAAATLRDDWPDTIPSVNWATSQAIAHDMETRFHRAVADLLDEMADHAVVEPADGTCNEAALAVARACIGDAAATDDTPGGDK